MRLALVCCANGLGHVKRLIEIIVQLADRVFLPSIALFCEEYQVNEIEKWDRFQLLSGRVKMEITPVSLPVRWRVNEDYYGEWLLDWHDTMATWRLDRFDHVISDNLVEPLFHTDHVTLIGSFLWHEVLREAFPNNGVIRRYRGQCKGLLNAKRIDMIANCYFATPGVYDQTKLHKVGLIHFCPSKDIAAKNRSGKRALIAVGGAQLGDGGFEQLCSFVPLLQQVGIKALAPPWLCDSLADRFDGIEAFTFWSGDFASMDIAIIRGGLGTISDCIAAKVPMFYLDDPNPEINFNQTRLSHMGIGLSVRQLLNEGPELLMDNALFQDMRSSMSGLNLRGEIEAADVLERLLQDNRSGLN